MKICSGCRKELADDARFCTECGRYVYGERIVPEAPPPAAAPSDRTAETMYLPALYAMVALLVLALIFPPWESGPGSEPRFLGFHFIMSAPEEGARVSRLLITIELTTVAVAGLYVAWLFRVKKK